MEKIIENYKEWKKSLKIKGKNHQKIDTNKNIMEMLN